MNWNIIFFESKRREKSVEEFIKSQEPPTIAKISHEIDLLEKYGSNLGMPHSKKLSQNIYELRIRGKQEIRIIYAFINKNIYLLHTFKKQSQKVPFKELEVVSKRLKYLTLRGGT